MSTKLSMDMRLGQDLKLTPQLQQAIKLLQMSSIELEQHIDQALERNPLLEREEEQATDASTHQEPTLTAGQASTKRSMEHDGIEIAEIKDSLHDHLQWQALCAGFTQDELAAALHIISNINDEGFLTCSTTTLISGFQSEMPHNHANIEQVLNRVRQFDPPGIAATTLSDCLLRQLSLLPQDNATTHAAHIIQHDLKRLGQHDLAYLKKQYRLNDTEIANVITLIRSLNPKPGAPFTSNSAQYITPDVIVEKLQGQWHVRLNTRLLPRLRINQHYSTLLTQSNKATDTHYLRDCLQEARWLIKSLEKRNDTLLRTSRFLVQTQGRFFNDGPGALRPLILHDVASRLNLHDSTISRITNGKFMLTPHGVFELKYFFSSHVHSHEGKAVSSTAIREKIRAMIANENTKSPLSDQQITDRLSENGIRIARRTVAKYREALGIASANLRKGWE